MSTRRDVGAVAVGPAPSGTPEEPKTELLVGDHFAGDRRPGSVVGSAADLGGRRRGRDRERSLAVDGGALRIPWLSDPGWGRAALTYGPFDRRPGRLVAVTVLNGLSTSQTPNRPPGGREMVARWRRTFPRVQLRRPDFHESMAVGWFTRAAAIRERRRPRGASIVASSSLADEIGTLDLAGWGSGAHRVRDDVQNVPVTHVVLLRDGDAMAYASSMADVAAFPAWPHMRPLGIVSLRGRGPLFPGVQQAVIGEVEYQLDSRVFDVTVADVPDLSRWWSSAVVADALTGRGAVGGTEAEVGGRWEPGGGLERSPLGAIAVGRTGSCTHHLPGVIGLLHATVGLRGAGSEVSLRWEAAGAVEWRLAVTTRAATLLRVDGTGVQRSVASLRPGRRHDLQLVDDGRGLAVAVDGRVAFGSRTDAQLAVGSPVTAVLSGRGASIGRVEAHPLDVVAPPALSPRLPTAASASRIVVADGFSGPPGDLAGTPTDGGSRARWERTVGVGVIERTGAGEARVRASRRQPNPGRTIYTVPWSSPDLVDLRLTVVPPGTAWGQGHRGRAGVALWQGPDDHLAVNTFLDDTSVGVSVSAFGHLAGRETMREHDATWTNVNPRISYGVPYELRVSSDGTSFTCWVDGEAVLHRRFDDYVPGLPRLRFTRVGLLANWEWGDDTGSTLRRFIACGR